MGSGAPQRRNHKKAPGVPGAVKEKKGLEGKLQAALELAVVVHVALDDGVAVLVQGLARARLDEGLLEVVHLGDGVVVEDVENFGDELQLLPLAEGEGAGETNIQVGDGGSGFLIPGGPDGAIRRGAEALAVADRLSVDLSVIGVLTAENGVGTAAGDLADEGDGPVLGPEAVCLLGVPDGAGHELVLLVLVADAHF